MKEKINGALHHKHTLKPPLASLYNISQLKINPQTSILTAKTTITP